MVSQQGATPVEANEPTSAMCCHHWIIEPAAGPVSQGKCQKCQAVREFSNSVETPYLELKYGRETTGAGAGRPAAVAQAPDESGNPDAE